MTSHLSDDPDPPAVPSVASVPSLPPFGAVVRYFLGLGTWGFGGPVALVGAMRRDLVEQRGWLTEDEYREGLALAQVAPGPLAAQLAIYIGYVYRGALGGAVVGFAFVVPSLVMVLCLGWAYRAYQGLPWVQAVFYGVGAAVIGIIANSAWGLTQKTLKRDLLLWSIALVLAVATVITGREIVWLVVLGGVVVVARLRSRGGMAHEGASVLLAIVAFFTYAGAFVFGSGLAIVPFLHGGVVLEHRWLSEAQFRDAVAVALITPGPVVITTAFIGFLVAGLAGGLLAAAATFLPCYVFTVVPAPFFRRHGRVPWVAALVDGITAAAVGAIAGAVVVLARGAIVDGPTAGLAIATLATRRFLARAPEPVLVLLAAAVGLALR